MILSSSIVGYIGMTIFTLKYIPIIRDYQKTRVLNYKPYLLVLESIADAIMTTYGVLIKSNPLIAMNTFCFTTRLSLFLHYKCTKPRHNGDNIGDTIYDSTGNLIV